MAAIAAHCARLAGTTRPQSLWQAASSLDTTTLFGAFKIDLATDAPDKPPDRATPVDRHRPPGPGTTLSQVAMKPTAAAIPADPHAPAIYTAATTSHYNMRTLTTTHYFASSFRPCGVR
jgi:hypothetical protein